MKLRDESHKLRQLLLNVTLKSVHLRQRQTQSSRRVIKGKLEDRDLIRISALIPPLGAKAETTTNSQP